MLFLARKNLFQEKVRLFLSIGGVAFSVILMVMLMGLYQGISGKIAEYIRTVPADAWVKQAGTEDSLLRTQSLLPFALEDKLEGVEGVKEAKPFSARRAPAKAGNNNISLYVVGYDAERDIGQPTAVVEGKSLPGKGEIIVDDSLNKKVKLGDTVEIASQKFKVTGISTGGNLIGTSFAFIVKEDLNKIQLLPNVTNFFLVNAAPGTDVDKLVAGIDRDVPGVEAVAKPVFVDNNVKVVTENILPIILVLLVIGVVVGIAVIALTIFTSTIEKATEYGVLKAIGFRNGQLYRVVAQQALIAGVIGYTVGALISVGLSFAVPRSVPQFVTQIRLFDLAWILGLTLGMSILAAYIPTRRLAKIDPAEVFRG